MMGVSNIVRLRCFLLRSALVGFADGTLPEPARADVERHLSRCPHCTEDVVALREVPAMLRQRVAPAPDEAFWARQRESILRTVTLGVATAPPRPATRRAHLRWLVAAPAAVAALSLVVRMLGPTESATRTAAHTTTRSGGETIAALIDEPEPIVAENLTTVDDATMASLGASLDEEIGDLSDASLI